MLKFGTDPEFATVIYTDGIPVVISPALLEKKGLIKKIIDDEKHPVYIETDNYNWIMDGVAFELTLKQPQENFRSFFNVIKESLNHLQDYISHLNLDGENLELYTKPIVNINPEMYDLNDESILQGFIFGCDEDYDAGDTGYRCVAIDVATHPYRYFGGHLHISGNNRLYELIRPAIMLQAICTGNFCTANSLFPELDRQRVSTYGRPLRYRPQRYRNGDVGLEYRTPSNAWCSLGIEKIEELFFWMTKGVELLDNEKRGIPILNEFRVRTEKAITTCDQKESLSILKEIEYA